jgi:hypothetical protein
VNAIWQFHLVLADAVGQLNSMLYRPKRVPMPDQDMAHIQVFAKLRKHKPGRHDCFA